MVVSLVFSNVLGVLPSQPVSKTLLTAGNAAMSLENQTWHERNVIIFV